MIHIYFKNSDNVLHIKDAIVKNSIINDYRLLLEGLSYAKTHNDFIKIENFIICADDILYIEIDK